MAAPRKIGPLLLLLAVGGCVSSQVEQLRQAPVSGQAENHEAVVVLGRKQNIGEQAEAGVVSCVTERLAGGDMRVLGESEFRDRMFPWFEPRTAPQDPKALSKLLADQSVGNRLSQLGVRYLVWLDGHTSERDRGGGMSCAAGPGGGGCLGFVWWENQAEYEAAIWDMHKHESVGLISVDSRGTSYMPALLVPIPLVARTRTAACESVANQLDELLTGQ